MDVVKAGNNMVSEEWEFACLHGRGFEFNKFDSFKRHGYEWLKPNTEHQWVLGTLTYVVNKEGAKKFCSVDYWVAGCNIDLFLWSNRHKYCLLDPRQFMTNEELTTLQEYQMVEHPRPFIHDRSQGSVIENPKNKQYVNP